MVKEYVAAGYGMTNAEAARVGPELETLLARTGGKTSAFEVLRAARNPASAMHRHITWDRKVAAQRWQLHEANDLCMSVAVRLPRPDGSHYTRPLMVSVEIQKGDDLPCEVQDTARRIYIASATIGDEPDMLNRMMEKALSDLRTWRRHYQTRAEIAGEFAERFQPVLEAMDAIAAPEEAAA